MRLFRNFIFTFFLGAFSAFFAFLAGELFVRYAVFTAHDRALGAEALWRSHQNLYTLDSTGKEGHCSISNSTSASPYLQFLPHPSPNCENGPLNNLSILDGRDYPLVPDPAYFDIVLLGGSVASQIITSRGRTPSWLEDELNNNYISPNGKPFRFFSGASGSWHFPNQITFLSLYGDSMDAAIALDGFNEAEKAGYYAPIYYADQIVYSAALRSLRLPSTALAIVLTGDLRTIVLSSPLLKKSYLLYGLFLSAMNFTSGNHGIMGEEFEIVGNKLNFPPDVQAGQRLELSASKYGDYIKTLSATAAAYGIPYAHFVQPNRLIGKTLTEEEKLYKQTSSAETYQKIIIEPSKQLAKLGFHTFLLTSVFENEAGAIYGDEIHCLPDGHGGNRGYALMAKAMAEKIAGAWRLRKK